MNIYLQIATIILLTAGASYLYYRYTLDDNSKRIDKHMEFVFYSYNRQNYNAIYDRFDEKLKKNITQANFKESMTQFHQVLGDMITFEYSNPFPVNPLCHAVLVAFRSGLSLAVFSLCLNIHHKYETFAFDFQGQISMFNYLTSQLTPNNSVSLYVMRDGVPMIDFNGNNQMQLMSTYQTIVAIQYAWQVTQGKINPQTWIDIKEQLNLFYLPNVDGGHTTWLKLMAESGKIVNGKIRLQNIPLGMISHSSNCNTEFLQGLLGMENLRGMMYALELKNYTEPYYLVSSLLALQRPSNVSVENYTNYLNSLTHSQVVSMANQIHLALANDANPDLRDNDQWLLNGTVLDAYSRIAMTGTAQDFTTIMRQINSGQFFDQKTQQLIVQIMGVVVMHHDFGQIHFSQAGVKGGSNNFPGMSNAILGLTGYGTLQNGTRIQYAMFFNQLQNSQFIQILMQSQTFTAMLETNMAYLNEVSRALSQN